MKTTTITIPKKLKSQLYEFKNKDESYNDVVIKLLESAKRRMIDEFLISDKGCISIEQALKEVREKYPEKS